MGGQETKSGKNPEQPQQEKFGLVGTDRLIKVIRNSTFLLEPQKVRLEQLIRDIPGDLSPLPANVVSSVIIQRAGERDAAVNQNEYLSGKNTELRNENQMLEKQVSNLRRKLSKKEEEEERRQELEDVFDGSITEKRIFERMLKAHGTFVEDLQVALNDITCKNADFDGRGLLLLAFKRLLGVDIDKLSPLERREIDWLAKDLGYDEDHEVDTEPIRVLITSLEHELEKAREIPQEDAIRSENGQPEKEDTTQ